MKAWASTEGAPFPQGVAWIEAEQAYNFSLYSKHAQTVTLLLYRADNVVQPAISVALDPLVNKTGRFWHCRLPKAGILGAEYYAYAVTGPAPEGHLAWHAFDPQKILLDPYAGSVYFPKGFDRQAARQPGSNAGKAPLGVLSACEQPCDNCDYDVPDHDWDAIIYELHVRGFTKHPSSGVDAEKRGTYVGLVDKIPYLLDLGVTIVELMPVFQFDPQDGNYWGYMPLNLFSPHIGYAALRDGEVHQPQHEFRAMVRSFHKAGIEVALDVVYNHTCESDETGPLYSYKGIDNSTYYLTSDIAGHRYENFSGTGNTLHCANRQVRQLVLDSLRHWASEGVNGFRFDLASVFSRNLDGTINIDDAQLFSDIVSDPKLATVRLIAEPWDVGAYQLGRQLPGVTWAQWNGRYRDDLRRFVRGDGALVGALMQNLYGSDDLFPDDRMHSYHPTQSINFITSHDGFSLYDLVSYNHKHNAANGHGDMDGVDENDSWNCGWEGDDGVPEKVLALRKQQAKNFCCLLFLSNGTPMFRAGDEFLQTQGGNNNPYNQDNATTWLDWDRLAAQQAHFRFFKHMLAFRKAHPSLGRNHFWREDVRWHGVGAQPDLSETSHSLAFCLLGASQDDDDLYVMINAWWQPLTFAFQGEKIQSWRRVIDTSLASPDDFLEVGKERPVTEATYTVQPRSLAVFIRPKA